ncbi:MAG TPA: hypothetical protein VKU77_03200 [Streptosporangiaceae bacterium]|nr:hypothetical protein [Streptosporangiaceae bacterium]
MRRLRLRYGNPLLDPAARVWAGASTACCAVLVIVLGVIFAHQTGADRFDHAVDSPVITWLDRHPGLAGWLAFPGSLPAAVPLTAAVVAGAAMGTGTACGLALLLDLPARLRRPAEPDVPAG